MKTTTITSPLLSTLRPELDAAVKQVADKYGITIHFGNARFTELSATFTVNIGLAPSADFDPDKALWDQNCKSLGLMPEDFGKEFCFLGEKILYRISGYNPKGRSNNIRIVRLSDGKEFITDALSVKAGLGIQIQKVAPPIGNQAQQPTPPAPTAEEKLRTAKMEWDLNCWRIGMKQEDFGKTVVLEGHLFRICGIRPRATVNSVVILDVKKNKEYVSSPDAIRKAWAGQQQ